MAIPARENIICVDDEYIVLDSLRREFRQNTFFSKINIEFYESGLEALKAIDEIIAEDGIIQVVITDQRMPGMNGDSFLEKVKTRSPDTLCILLTGYSDLEAVTGLVNKSYLYRFIGKPWDRNDLLLTVTEACEAYRKEQMLEEKKRMIDNLAMTLVAALESANRFYDEDTGSHIQRIAMLSGFIAQTLGMDDDFVKRIRLYSSLHDIGKVGIPQDILKKPGKLTPEEFTAMQEHVIIGHKIIDQDGIDEMAKNIVLFHHEKWQGEGYVYHLQGDRIPIEARIVAIADVFDALRSPRVYKEPFPQDKVVEIMKAEAGKSFDPDLVNVFLAHVDEVLPSMHYPDVSSRQDEKK